MAGTSRFLETARAALKAEGYTLTGIMNLPSDGLGSVSPSCTVRLANERLDQAVAAAYGWDWPLSDDEILTRLLALNLKRAGRTPAPA